MQEAGKLGKFANDGAIAAHGGLAPGALAYLTVFLENGRLEIDNNLVGNAIRPTAVQNHLFNSFHSRTVASLTKSEPGVLR